MPCQAHLGELSGHKSEFDRRNIAIVVISLAPPSKLFAYEERHRWPFVILSDPERKGYQALGLPRLSLWRIFSPSTLGLYLRLLWRGMKPEPYGGEDVYQAGGDFLLDSAGKVLYAHPSKDPSDRPATAMLLQEIDRIKSPSA